MANARGKAVFIDGSRYQGTWDDFGMAGVGSFRMPHGVLYEGEIKDGMHHGNGTLVYPGGQIIDGVWNRGELKKWRYTFSDGLVFDPENSMYCKFPDRRFNRSKVEGLKPAGRSLKTEEQPTKIIPLDCYDTGDGIFDPVTLCVTSFEHPSEVLRNPSADEVRWIMQHCRRGTAEPTGFQPWLNENWSTEPPELPYRLPMSNDSPQSWWKRLSTFEKDTSVLLEKLRKSAEEGRDTAQISSNSRSGEDGQESVGNYQECVCVPESEPEIIEDVCGLPLDVCGRDRDSKDQLPVGYKQREVICEEITSSDEWGEGEDRKDLLMTVCCAPEGTYTIRKKKTSTQSSLMNGPSKGSIVFSRDIDILNIYGRDNGSIAGEDVEEYQWYDYGGAYDHWGAEDSWQISHGLVVRHSKESNDLQGRKTQKRNTKKRKSRKDTKKSKRNETATGKRKKKSSRCPDFSKSYAEHLLQQKVGNLLFSPALEPPRSPVYLVKRPCNLNTCRKLEQLRKRRSFKSGVSSSQQRSQRKKQRRITCNEKSTRKSEMQKICSPSIPFITVLHGQEDLIERNKCEVN